VASAFARVTARLAQGGATTADVVRIRVFVKDLTAARARTVVDRRGRTFPPGSWPASTIVGVDALAREAFDVEVEAVAVVGEPGAGLSIERHAPAGGRSGAVAVTAHGVRTVYVSGQTGEGGGLAIQSRGAWRRLGDRLRDAGAGYPDLVKTTAFIVELDPSTYYDLYHDGVPAEVSTLEKRAARTLVGVPGLSDPRAVVEIDAVAVVPVDGISLDRAFLDPGRTFSQAVAVGDGRASLVHLSAQGGLPGDPLEAQVDQAYASLGHRLALAGATPRDLLKVTIYMPGYSEGALPALAAARRRHGFGDGPPPASTLLGIETLRAGEAAVEIDGVALVRQ